MSTTRSSQALVRAAVELIAESGLDGLTLKQVAGRAGVSRATAYREFGDKDGLIGAVARHEVQQMIAATLAGVDMRAEPDTLVRSTTLFALRYLRGHPAFGYIRDHEPHWLLNAVFVVGEATGGMNLVQTVATMVAPVIAADERLALQPVQAAELVVRTVLSHSLIELSSLSDEQVADSVTRAITR
ncbi:MAG: TetR/AcrR family transcriptional regulator [Mycobacterium sp.]|nr:TetR/AcrR family transcriptional regulator [Mycobacterium sp.]